MAAMAMGTNGQIFQLLNKRF
jgi:hypothetical protein